MTILKEDGSLDVERMNRLPLEEWMDEMGDLTQEQVEEYLSKLPINESNEPVRAIEVDYTLEEELKRGLYFRLKNFLEKFFEITFLHIK